jgi:hypothetical protein
MTEQMLTTSEIDLIYVKEVISCNFRCIIHTQFRLLHVARYDSKLRYEICVCAATAGSVVHLQMKERRLSRYATLRLATSTLLDNIYYIDR